MCSTAGKLLGRRQLDLRNKNVVAIFFETIALETARGTYRLTASQTENQTDFKTFQFFS